MSLYRDRRAVGKWPRGKTRERMMEAGLEEAEGNAGEEQRRNHGEI
jgi:hypothetical protein